MPKTVQMTQVVTKWVRNQGSQELSRRIVAIVKRGRWLEDAGGRTYDPKTLKETKASRGCSNHCYRLEPIKESQDQ